MCLCYSSPLTTVPVPYLTLTPLTPCQVIDEIARDVRLVRTLNSTSIPAHYDILFRLTVIEI